LGCNFLLYNPGMAEKRSLKMLLEILHQEVPSLAERYGVQTLEVFGSYVRGEQKTGSDLDVLVTFHEPPSLLTFLAIENHLSDLLGVKVDLVMKDSLKPGIGKNVLREAVPV
jgi:uncharacterized protein